MDVWKLIVRSRSKRIQVLWLLNDELQFPCKACFRILLSEHRKFSSHCSIWFLLSIVWINFTLAILNFMDKKFKPFPFCGCNSSICEIILAMLSSEKLNDWKLLVKHIYLVWLVYAFWIILNFSVVRKMSSAHLKLCFFPNWQRFPVSLLRLEDL